jgi:hypothetical protein
MFSPSRDEARRFLIEAWNKRRAGPPLSDLERIAVAIIARHPEYHALLEEDNLDRDWRPESGDVNPFLHLSLHLAIAEQLAIDQPPGIRAEFERIRVDRETSTRHSTRCSSVWGKYCGTRSDTAPRPTRRSTSRALRDSGESVPRNQCLTETVAGCAP